MSKSVHADMRLKMNLSQAEAYMRDLEEASARCIAHGPGPSGTDVDACHYTSRGPYLAQRIDELKRGITAPPTPTFAPGVRLDDPAASDWKATATKPTPRTSSRPGPLRQRLSSIGSRVPTQ